MNRTLVSLVVLVVAILSLIALLAFKIRPRGLDPIPSPSPTGRTIAEIANDPQLVQPPPELAPQETSRPSVVDRAMQQRSNAGLPVQQEVHLFDGISTQGWTGAGPWTVDGGVLTYPVTKRLEEDFECTTPLTGPCEVSLEIQLIGRAKEDARGFWIKGAHHAIHLRLDDAPDQFKLSVSPERRDEVATCRLQEGAWYELRCRVDRDGALGASLDGHSVLTSSWSGSFPARLGLRCERSGGKFRNIRVRYL